MHGGGNWLMGAVFACATSGLASVRSIAAGQDTLRRIPVHLPRGHGERGAQGAGHGADS
jgi:hypothetical protein